MKNLNLSGLLFAALLVTGCADKGTPESAPPEAAAEPAAHSEENHAEAHSHGTGPNGGVVFDLGKCHAEFTVDHPKHECTILFLGADQKSPEPVAATELTLNQRNENGRRQGRPTHDSQAASTGRRGWESCQIRRH